MSLNGVDANKWVRVCGFRTMVELIDCNVQIDISQTATGCTLRVAYVGYDSVEFLELPYESANVAKLASTAMNDALRHSHLNVVDDVVHGLLSVEEVQRMGDRAHAEWLTAREFQRQRTSEVIDVAEELGLYPDADGRAPGRWFARWPEQGHQLELQMQTNLFRCGYCRVGGGPAELRELVASRRTTKKGRS